MGNLDNLFTAAPSMSHDEAIEEFIRLDNIIKEAARERAWAASILAAKADSEREGDLKTVHIESSDRKQKVKVEFKTDWKVQDQSEIETVKDLLGEPRFNEIFKTEYTPKARPLQSFLNTSSGDERFRTAKQIVRDFVKQVPKTPSVSIEKS